MPILITADWHLSDNPRDSYRIRFIQEWIPRMLENCDALYVLGDLTEDKNFHGGWLVNTIVEIFYRLGGIARVVVLRGNHDYTREGSPFFEFLKRVPNITWINEPLTIDGHLFLPHTSNHKRDWKGLDFRKQKVIFCHQTFDGFTENGRKLQGGIDRHVFPTNIRVFSGDVHTPQKIDNVTYVGAPYTVDFGDTYKPRILKLFAPGELSLSGGKMAVGSIPCEGPQKRLLEITTEPLDNLHHPGGELGEGDILKIRVKLAAGEKEQWPEIRKNVLNWCIRNKYEIWQIQPVFDTAKRRAAWKQATPEGDKETLSRYGKIKQVPDRTLQTGQWLIDAHEDSLRKAGAGGL